MCPPRNGQRGQQHRLGDLENPALLPLLPQLCERLLGEPLRLPSVDTWWCGDSASLDHVLANVDSLVIRPISRPWTQCDRFGADS